MSVIWCPPRRHLLGLRESLLEDAPFPIETFLFGYKHLPSNLRRHLNKDYWRPGAPVCIADRLDYRAWIMGTVVEIFDDTLSYQRVAWVHAWRRPDFYERSWAPDTWTAWLMQMADWAPGGPGPSEHTLLYNQQFLERWLDGKAHARAPGGVSSWCSGADRGGEAVEALPPRLSVRRRVSTGPPASGRPPRPGPRSRRRVSMETMWTALPDSAVVYEEGGGAALLHLQEMSRAGRESSRHHQGLREQHVSREGAPETDEGEGWPLHALLQLPSLPGVSPQEDSEGERRGSEEDGGQGDEVRTGRTRSILDPSGRRRRQGDRGGAGREGPNAPEVLVALGSPRKTDLPIPSTLWEPRFQLPKDQIDPMIRGGVPERAKVLSYRRFRREYLRRHTRIDSFQMVVRKEALLNHLTRLTIDEILMCAQTPRAISQDPDGPLFEGLLGILFPGPDQELLRYLLVWRIRDGRKDHEIAYFLSVPLGTIQVLRARAEKIFRDFLRSHTLPWYVMGDHIEAHVTTAEGMPADTYLMVSPAAVEARQLRSQWYRGTVDRQEARRPPKETRAKKWSRMRDLRRRRMKKFVGRGARKHR